MSNIVQFRELERAQREDSDEVVVYDGVAHGAVFVYLYLNSITYTLVWTGAHDIPFNIKLPYSLMKLQFSYMSQPEVELIDFILPERRPRQPSLSGKQHFYYESSVATLILADETSQKLTEYNLLDNENDRREYVEIFDRPESVSRIAFARYDSKIVSVKHGQVDCCFTAERPQNAETEGWEFAVSLPRTSLLTKRALKWISRNHQDAKLMHKLAFVESQAALANKLGLQTEPISSEKIR